GMPGDAARPLRRATRECAPHRGGEVGDEVLVLGGTPLRVAHTTPFARLAVGKALLFGPRDGLRLDEGPLALVPLASAAPLHHNGREPAGLARAAGQCGVTAR